MDVSRQIPGNAIGSEVLLDLVFHDYSWYFQKTGAEGGKTRARKHTREELSAWGKKGGRPRGSKKIREGGKSK
jgi:hypothetical protein